MHPVILLPISMCATQWLTPIRGMFNAIDIDLATDPPTLRQGPRPGPWLNATASISDFTTFQSNMARSRRVLDDSTWWSAASRG